MSIFPVYVAIMSLLAREVLLKPLAAMSKKLVAQFMKITAASETGAGLNSCSPSQTDADSHDRTHTLLKLRFVSFQAAVVSYLTGYLNSRAFLHPLVIIAKKRSVYINRAFYTIRKVASLVNNLASANRRAVVVK